MTLLTLILGLALAGPLHADALALSPTAAAAVQALPTAQTLVTPQTSLAPQTLAEPQPALGAAPAIERDGASAVSATLPPSPDAVLRAHPHGPLAARALIAKAASRGDLAGAEALLRRAMREGRGHGAGSAAALELAHLYYARGRPALGLAALERAEVWPRPGALQPDWLYWRGQSRLALKRWGRAVLDFRQLIALWPGDAHAAGALLGEADCEAVLHEDERAVASYGSLVNSAFGAQALWGLATLRLREGRWDEARLAYARLRTAYPASFEAQAAGPKLDALALKPKAPTHLGTGRSGRWSVQVGAYSKLRWADVLVRQLRRHRFRVKVGLKQVDGRTLYLVQVGPYASNTAAAAAAQILQTREKLPFNLVEE